MVNFTFAKKKQKKNTFSSHSKYCHITLSEMTNFKLFHGLKTLGKGEIACYKQFLLFLKYFQKTLAADTYKTRACLGKVKGHLKWRG